MGAQTISYEISLALIVIQFILCYMSHGLVDLQYSNIFLIYIFPFVLIIWLVILLAETNRTPFDFSEGESELVSGFNIEYASVGFVLIFLSEYAIILLFSTASIRVLLDAPLFSLFAAVIRVLIRGV